MKILLITGHFPPERSGGIARPFSLYKYLPENDIKVHVLTKDLVGKMADENDVLRYDSMWTWRRSSFLSIKVFFKLISLVKNKIYGINYDEWWVRQVEKNIKDYQSKDINLIYATFPGPEVLEVALILKKKLQLPLIVEFRDGLAFESLLYKPNILHKAITRMLERKIIGSANNVISIGEKLSEYFEKKYDRKVYTVFNGYEESDFNEITNNNRKQDVRKKCLVHFGSLSNTKKSNRTGFFKCLKKLKGKEIIDGKNFSLIFIGNLTNNEKGEILSYGLKDVITFLPYMSKKEGFNFIASHADYLLFYGVPNETTVISGKLLEYIKLDKPIIGICKGNEAESIIQKTGTGEICDFDENAIEELLLKMINNTIFYKPDYKEIEKFNRRNQAGKIAEIIKNTFRQQSLTV